MRVLVTAFDRRTARRVAHERYPLRTKSKTTVDNYVTSQGDDVTVGIFGQELGGRSFDRIVIAEQKKMPEPYGTYLIFRLAMGGRFERHD